MPKLTVRAGAKLNLHLRVGGRQPDGFHPIESIFLSLAFGDTLYIETSGGEGCLEIVMEGQGATNTELAALPLEKNIIYKAVSLFREKTAYKQGLKIRVDKRIPPGGGLGGGSSNAAATLLALNFLAAPPNSGENGLLRCDSLFEIGASLGSDVPFFLHQASAAWASGRGERILPLEAPKTLLDRFFVLVTPDFSSETAAAYRLLDESRSKNASDSPLVRASPPEHLLQALAGPPEEWPFGNDFLGLFASGEGDSGDAAGKGATYQAIISRMRAAGAEFAGLSGSGSTCFGVFPDRAAAEKAGNLLLKTNYQINVTFPLANCALGVLK